MRSIVTVVTVSAFAMLSPTANADELEKSGEKMTLPQLFGVAVRTAPELQNAAFSLQLAEAQLTASAGSHDFVLTAGTEFGRSLGTPTIPGIDGNGQDVLDNELSIRKLLPTNGTLELIGSLVSFTTDNGVLKTKQITAGTKLRLTQPLLQNAGSVAAYKAFDAARAHRSAALIRQSAVARTYAVQVIRAYWQLALSWRALEVRRAGVELAKKQIAIAEAGIRTGKFAPSELLPVQQAIATRQQEILAAQLDVAQGSIALRRLVGMEVLADKFAVRTIELPEPAAIPLDSKTFVELALRESADLKAAMEDQKSAEAAAAGSKRSVLPRLDLRIEGGPQGSDVTLTDGDPVMPKITHNPTFGGAVNKLSAGGYSVDANLTLEWALGNHTTSGLYEADAATALNFKFLVGKTRADVAADVIKTVYSARVHLESAELGAKAVAAAEANVDAETKKFENGKSSSAEIIRRQDDLETARLRQAVEIAAYHVALAELEAASGTILAKYGLKILDYKR
jgi:outer membrane protein TolC